MLTTLDYGLSQIKESLQRFNVNIEAQAVDSRPSNASPNGPGDVSAEVPTKESIWRGWVDALKRPPIFETSESPKDNTGLTVLIWELSALLGRTKDRLRAPFVSFKTNVDIQASPSVTDEDANDPYLPSLVPAPVNLLEHLNDFSNLNVSLPSDRLTHFFPPSRAFGARALKPKIQKSRRYKILPALTTRIRYSKLSFTPSQSSVIAALDTEMAPGLPNGIIIESVSLKLEDGEAERLGQGIFPFESKKCHSRDVLGYIFRLTPNPNESRHIEGKSTSLSQRSAIKKGLDVTIYATILSSSSCKPKIEMRWHTEADFSSALNPLYSTPGQGTQRGKQPPSFPDAGAASQDKHEISAHARHSWGKFTESTLGLTITFTAPKEKLVPGCAFHWDIFVVNKSSQTRKLMVGATPVHSPPRTHTAKGSNGSASSVAVRQAPDHAPAQVVSLSTDIKVGPLAPGSCQETRLKLLPLKAGVLRLEGIRITDVLANEYIDIRQDDLPDVIVEEEVKEVS